MPIAATWTDGRPVLPLESLADVGPIGDWLVAGPFPLRHVGLYRDLETGRALAIDEDPVGAAETIRPVEGDVARSEKVATGEVRWERVSGAARYDLKARYPGVREGIVYAATYLVARAETTILLRAESVEVYKPSMVQVYFDGIEIGHGDAPAAVRVALGEHRLLVKISGGCGFNYAWSLAVSAGVACPVGDGVMLGLVGFPGWWRDNDTPRAEVSATVFNAGDAAIVVDGLRARIGVGSDGPEGPPIRVEPGEAREVRLSAPIGDCTPGAEVRVTVSRGDMAVSTQAVLPQMPEPGTIHLMQGFHCDPVWVSDQHHYNLISLDNVRMMLDACRADADYRFFVHEIDYLRPFIDEYPAYRDEFFRLAREGRISLGTSYNEPNENTVSGEAIIRNIVYGRGFFRTLVGAAPTVYHAWDVFGHIPQLSQILAKSGHAGTVWSKSIYGFPPVFRHMSPDGTVLRHVRTHYTWFSHDLDNLREIVRPLMREKHTYGLSRHLFVQGSDFRPPAAWPIGNGAAMADSRPRVVMSGAEEFLAGLDADGARLPLTSRNPSQHHVGTFHSRVELKLANRMAENALYAAELWSTFAALMGATYPDKALDKAWRQLLFNEHHDAITGTPCDISYLDLMAGYREALELAREVLGNATRAIAGAVEAPREGQPIVVFNPLAWRRDAVVRVPVAAGTDAVEVRDADGASFPATVDAVNAVILARDLPPAGYTTLAVYPTSGAVTSDSRATVGSADDDAIARLPVIENEFLRIALDPARGGGIASLVDKATRRDLIDASAGVGNDLVAHRERENPWEFWTTGEVIRASERSATVTIETTPVGQTAVITGQLGEICRYRRTLTLRPGQRTIEACVSLIGYHGVEGMFAVTTPVAIAGALPIYEDRFATVVGRRGMTKGDYRTSGSARPSDCAIFPVYNWMEAGWSARAIVGRNDSALNLGMAGVVIPRDPAIEDALAPLYAALGTVGVGITPYYDDDDAPRKAAANVGEWGPLFYHHLSDDSVMARRDDLAMCAEWIAVDVGGTNGYVRDLLARLPGAAAEKLAAGIGKHGWAMIVAEDDAVPDGWPAQPVIILSARDGNALVDAVAEIAAGIAKDAAIRLPAGTDFRKKPGVVDDAGFAILTSGTGAATMEPDGALTLFLDRTSSFAEKLIDRTVNPNWRDAVYHYAFLPHAGSWRDGGVVRAGYEYNHPAEAVAPDCTTGALPGEMSFLSFTAADAVVSSVKPAGNPMARLESAPSNPAAGIVVRAYDASGRGAHGRIRLARPIRSAATVDLVEENAREIAAEDCCADMSLAPFAIETVRLVPEPDVWPSIGPATLGRDREDVQPVWCRYWQHNAGAHPLGYLPVAVYLDGDLPQENAGGSFPTVNRVRLTVVNNQTDAPATGIARLLAPREWIVTPAEVPYDIPPRGHASVDITVGYHWQNRAGLLKARIEHEDQVYQDVIEAGYRTEKRFVGADGNLGSVRYNAMEIAKEREPEWSVFREGTDIVARVRNPWRETLDVELAIISPIETWGAAVDRYMIADLSPRHVGLAIPGRQDRIVRFTLGHAGTRAPMFWAWAKLMCHGKPAYRPVPGTTA